MKKIVLFLSIVFTTVTQSQVLEPQNFSCLILNQPEVDIVYSSGEINSLDCIETTSTINFNPNVNYSIKAGKSITFNPNTYIAPNNGYQFDAFIENRMFDLGWYEPSNVGFVGQFEKLEIGLQFNDSINTNILEYINTPHLDPTLSLDALNPYNPDDVDVYAEIYWQESPGVFFGPYIVNGFFYREFERNAADWSEINVPHNFRLRFTPRELGVYKVSITAKVKNSGEYSSEPFYFQCVPSSDPNASDFVEVGNNKRYFKIDDEPFFPVGQNLTGPNNSIRLAEWDPHPVIASDYIDFHNTMEDLKNNGGNYFRYITAPWQTEIEFENLGNYTNRLSNAWEFDRILDKAHELDLRIHFNMAIHYYFETPSGYAMNNWDWERYGDTWSSSPSFCFEYNNHEGYCYREELDMENPIDFLTDTVAIGHYQNRIRYMIARWGYSTNIAVLELLSEANNFGNQFELEEVCNEFGCGCLNNELPTTNPIKPYKEPSCPTCSGLYQWQNEMCRFIKEDLKHVDHPLAVNYTGEPDINNGDLSFYSEHVDIATYNYYALSINKAVLDYDVIEGEYHNTSSGKFLNKPFMHSEYGTGAYMDHCDNRVDYIKTLYFTPFVGLAGAAMNWDFHWNEYDSWQYLAPIKNFMAGIALDDENWQAGQPIIQSDNSLETYYLKSGFTDINSPQKAVGIIANRTYNYYTQATDFPCNNASIPEIDNTPIYQTAQSFPYPNTEPIKIPNMGGLKDYSINWYDALTGNFWQTTYETSNIIGNLELKFPGVITGSAVSPMLFFEVIPVGSSLRTGNTITHNEKQEINPNSAPADLATIAETEKIKITVFPNPTESKITVTHNLQENTDINWVLTDVNGSIINSGFIDATNFIIDLSVYNSGLYFLTIINPSGNFYYKIIKQ